MEQAEKMGHIHEASCYEEPQLVCEQDEAPQHQHEENCYSTVGDPICGFAEGEGEHTHGGSRYQAEQVSNCGEKELRRHKHTDECADGSYSLAEVIAHQHTDEYICETEESSEQVQTCPLPEHEHTPETG